MRSPTEASDSDVQELVVFRTADQDFCVDILLVREIRGWTRPASLPHAPSYVQGVINLRGSVVPIIDLAARFGLPPLSAHDRNVIIVTSIGTQTAGLLIEAVTDILSIPTSEIQPTPDVASDTTRSFVRGIVAKDKRLIRQIDVAQLLPKVGGVAA
jgi:purine-binding chemotaxis protein CheW